MRRISALNKKNMSIIDVFLKRCYKFYLMINIFSTVLTFSSRLCLICPCRTCESKLSSSGEIAWQPNTSSQGNNQRMYSIRNVFIIPIDLGYEVNLKRENKWYCSTFWYIESNSRISFFRHREKVLTDLVRLIICSFQTPRENEFKCL